MARKQGYSRKPNLGKVIGEAQTQTNRTQVFGVPGLDAFKIYKKYNPDYPHDEKYWSEVTMRGNTPMQRISSNTGNWEVSYDNGEGWIDLGVKAQGPTFTYEDLTDEEMLDLVAKVNVNAQRIPAVAPGVLPAGPAGQSRYMEVTAVGTWTYGGTTVGSNPQGSITTFWWDGSTWSLTNVVDLPINEVILPTFNPIKFGGYAINEQVRDTLGITYVSLKNSNSDALTVEDSWVRISPDFSGYYYPFIKEQRIGIAIKASQVVVELYIPNYDDDYNYQLLNVTRALNLVGYPPNMYALKIAKIEKANPANIEYLRADYYDVDDTGLILMESPNREFYALLDFSKMPLNSSFDADPSDNYLLDIKVSQLEANPQIKQRLHLNILPTFNSSKPGGYAIDEQIKGGLDVTYVSLKDSNSDSLTTRDSWARVNPDFSGYYYPFAKEQRVDIAIQASQAVLELYIPNYDNNYDYQLINVTRGLNLEGYPPNMYAIKLAKIEKANPSNVEYLRTDIYDLDDTGIVLLESANRDYYTLVDFSKMPLDSAFDADPNNDYLLDIKVSKLEDNPQIHARMKLNILEARYNEAKNNYFSYKAGVNANLGDSEYNFGQGHKSLDAVESASYNYASGIGCLEKHREGAGNVAIGIHAMQNSEECIDVTMVGWEAGRMMKSGVGDTGFGRRSIMQSEIAAGNTGFGDSTLYSIKANSVNGDGTYNVAMGYTAGEYCVTVSYSVMIGPACMRNVPSGDYNTIVGYQAMISRTVESQVNTAFGANVMLSNTGNYNSVFGAVSLTNGTGDFNSVFGRNAGNSIVEGRDNVVIGDSAQSGATDVSNAIVIGSNAKATKNNQTVLGTASSDEFVINGVTFTKAQLLALKALVS